MHLLRKTLPFALLLMALAACEDENKEPSNQLDVPASYQFERQGSSTVAFPGQTTRLKMAMELANGMLDFSKDSTTLLAQYANQGPNGGDVSPFSEAALNNSEKSLQRKTAASALYFASNATEAAAIRNDFRSWISAQTKTVFPAQNQAAGPGQPGQIADGTSVRYVNAKGLEYDQMLAKSLIGALMADQAINNYLTPAVLDAGANRADNDAGTTVAGYAYTTMEHKWDEAYGYVFGLAPNPAEPLATLGNDDDFLNKYLYKVDQKPAFQGIAQKVFDAFKRGRAAIVAGQYGERDAQAAIIQREISRLIAIMAVHYLNTGAEALRNNEQGTVFHQLSEAMGFLYSLRFTHDPSNNAPYFSRSEVDALLAQTYPEQGGFWNLQASDLEALAQQIAERFDFDPNKA
jgi:hypothetical protein